MGIVGGIPLDELASMLEDVSEMTRFGRVMIWESMWEMEGIDESEGF